ncbi:MAG TPA: hypothetical protein VKY31_00395, partial [Terriglobia bacterium]|nr:hypothetical protein [Terriglobia bacterium]
DINPGFNELRDSLLIDFRPLANRYGSVVWRIDKGMAELKWHGSNLDFRQKYIVEDIVYTDPEAARAAMAAIIPPPVPELTGASYLITAPKTFAANIRSDEARQIDVLAPPLLFVDAGTYAFYVAARPNENSGRLFAFNPQARNWKGLENELALNENDAKLLAAYSRRLVPIAHMQNVTVDTESGLIAYKGSAAANARFFLYDSKIDRTFDLGEWTDSPRPAKVQISRHTGLEGALITYGDTAFTYSSAGPQRIRLMKPPRDLLYLTADGAQIYRDRTSGKIVQKLPNQPERLLFPF